MDDPVNVIRDAQMSELPPVEHRAPFQLETIAVKERAGDCSERSIDRHVGHTQ